MFFYICTLKIIGALITLFVSANILYNIFSPKPKYYTVVGGKLKPLRFER